MIKDYDNKMGKGYDTKTSKAVRKIWDKVEKDRQKFIKQADKTVKKADEIMNKSDDLDLLIKTLIVAYIEGTGYNPINEVRYL